ncbi:Crinkler (CRN) [Phytophthora megakarya]|uniref:Crinkler (CRN) n=1 Tax=Phytophthora megakarya TaxID=4795 RepID=A0A225VIQ4_9STRA|nr:Crinkler (CRN) [Phytophthora megakarya]
MVLDEFLREIYRFRWKAKQRGEVSHGRGTGPIELGRSIKSVIVKREGKTLKDYLEVMTRWALNPNEMGYWVPASSLCQTIDAVAKWDHFE